MRSIFNTNYNHRNLDLILLVLRIGIALLMLSHGIPKLTILLNGEYTQFPDPMHIGAAASLVLAVFAEVGCSLLLLLGLATRLAVIPLIITMLMAVFVILGDAGLKEKELGLHFLLVYLLLLVAGAGRYSLDALINTRVNRANRLY